MLDMNEAQAEFNRRLFGQILVNKQIINEAQVQEAIQKQQTRMSNSKIGEILVRCGYISKSQLIEALAEQYGLNIITSLDGISAEVIGCIDGHIACLYRIIPVGVSKQGGKLVIAASSYEQNNIDNLERLLNRDVIVRLTDPVTLSHALNKYYDYDANSILDQIPPLADRRPEDIDEEPVGRLLSQPQTLADSAQFLVGVIEDLVNRTKKLEQRVETLEQMHSSIFEE